MNINGTKMGWLEFTVDAIFGPIFLSMALMKGPGTKNIVPTPLEAPQQDLGAPIGVLFGRKAIDPVLIGWYGDVTIVKVPLTTDGGKKGGKSSSGGGK